MAISNWFEWMIRERPFPIFNPDFAPLATFDASGTQVTIPLDQPLAAGHYRILLMGGNDLSDFLSGGTWDANVDQTLADFTVAQPGATLPDATDLGTIGPQSAERPRLPRPLGRSGQRRPVQVHAGPRPPLATGASARRRQDRQQLCSGAVSLFDGSGTAASPRAMPRPDRPDFPDDPFLFAGLNPGVYYVGVSGRRQPARPARRIRPRGRHDRYGRADSTRRAFTSQPRGRRCGCSHPGCGIQR